MDAADDYQEAMTQTWRKRARSALEALAARAAAAERLARAADAMEGSYRRHRSEDGGSADEHQEALGVFMAALEAWREASHA